MNPTMTAYLARVLPSETPPCIVEDVFLSLFYDIAATFLLFTVINWFLGRVLNFFGPRWFSRVWVCVKIRQIRTGVGVVLGGVRDAVREVLVYIAKSILVFFECSDAGYGEMTETKVVKEEVKKETCHYSTGDRSDGRAVGSELKIRLEDDSNRNWSNEHGNLSPDSARSNRLTRPRHIISNDTPGSGEWHRSRGNDNSSWKRPRPNLDNTSGSGVASSSSSPAVFTPSSTALVSPGSSDVSHTPSTPVHTPKSTTSSSTVEKHTPESSDTSSFGGWTKLTGTELLTYGEYLSTCTSPEYWKAVVWCDDLRPYTTCLP